MSNPDDHHRSNQRLTDRSSLPSGDHGCEYRRLWLRHALVRFEQNDDFDSFLFSSGQCFPSASTRLCSKQVDGPWRFSTPSSFSVLNSFKPCTRVSFKCLWGKSLLRYSTRIVDALLGPAVSTPNSAINPLLCR